ncbi:hypothetical protein M413DRAFT_358149 [Hebeloma cylindrosporum]|uniref:Uncharacterized protein n=1 Tax=Hebeloma cylindrosporum TaxID=76867 RepID=A0A0C2YUH8_HEBCY|nr:hypothetical protein M413DRAFT_358149 [Hebeloma cylindrosporum h7]
MLFWTYGEKARSKKGICIVFTLRNLNYPPQPSPTISLLPGCLLLPFPSQNPSICPLDGSYSLTFVFLPLLAPNNGDDSFRNIDRHLLTQGAENQL